MNEAAAPGAVFVPGHANDVAIFVEVSTLFEDAWSGIANVTANLCRSLLQSGHDVRFFAFDKVLKRSYVLNALSTNDGTGLQLLMDHGIAVEGGLQSRRPPAALEIGIFPNFKRRYQDFAFEILIVHDISFALMPELHDAARVHDYKAKLFHDVHAVNRVVCVSRATRDDLLSYYRVSPSKVSVAHPGVDHEYIASQGLDTSVLDDLGLATSRFFLVLGTIEPRKNIELIVEYIAANRRILDQYQFVFAGRQGWGEDFKSICASRRVADGRLIHLDYVTETQRNTLLRNCEALLFPSWFEGFGLPVVEAMAFGTPVIGSRTSSIVEVGGDALIGFDPSSIESFSAAIDHFRRLGSTERGALSRQCRTRALAFTWKGFRDAVFAGVPGLHSEATNFDTANVPLR